MLLLDRIDIKLEKTNDLVKAEVGAAEARMGTRVDDAVRSLRAEVGTAEARMEMKMESLGTKIGVAEERMGTRMDALETKMGTRMDALETKMGMRMDALDTRMEAAEAQFKGMMVKQDEFTKTIVKAQAVGTALVLIGGTLGTLITNGAQLKAFWDSL